MKNINYPLLIGGIIVIFLIVLSLFPGLFTNKDPLFVEVSGYIEYKENGTWIENFAAAPFRPNKNNIIGTDDAGRDVYSRLVYGARNTLTLGFLIALFRMTLALPLGLAAGMGVRFISSIIKIFNTFFTAIPMLLFSFMVLNISYFRTLQMQQAIFAFAIVLTIAGWAKLAAIIEDNTRRVMEEDFIEGEIAIGKSKLQIAYQNVIPHIIPSSVSLFFKEISMALFLVAQLAVLYVFVGLMTAAKDPISRSQGLNKEPEWSGALSRVQLNIKRYETVYWEYWLTVYPVLVFSIAVIGINLTGEGLRIEFQKRESRVISSIRKVYYIVSPNLFLSQIKQIKKYYKPVIAKTLVILSILAYSIIPWHPSQYQFDLDNAKLHLDELTKKEYNGRVAGTEGGYRAGQYIIDTLKEYGYQVATTEFSLTTDEGNGEIIPKPLAPMVIEKGWIKLTDDHGVEKTYQLHKDFSIATVSQKALQQTEKEEISYKGVAAYPQDVINIPSGTDFFMIEGKFQFLKINDLNNPNQIKVGKTVFPYDLKFNLEDDFNQNTNTYVYNSTAVIPFDQLKQDLQKGYREVEVHFDYPQLPQKPVRRIEAFLPGKGRTKENPGELIILGATYDGIQINGMEKPFAVSATPASIALEVARVLALIEEPMEKSIQFIFWDNDYDQLKQSPLDSSHYYLDTERMPINMAMANGYHYYDIAYPGYRKKKTLDITTYPIQRPDSNSYLMGLEIEERLKQMNIKYQRSFEGYHTRPIMKMVHNSLYSICFGSEAMGGVDSSMDTIDFISYQQMESIGQIILDTLTMNSYVMD